MNEIDERTGEPTQEPQQFILEPTRENRTHFSCAFLIIGLMIMLIIFAITISQQSKVIIQQGQYIDLKEKITTLEENLKELNEAVQQENEELQRLKKLSIEKYKKKGK